jgi:lysophospholipase L1-like esterase
VPNPPAIDCPADLSAQAHVGSLPKVDFEVPAARDGQPPVSVVCTPPSGSEFPPGKNTVVCEATDALARKGSCSFSVVVAPVPMLDKTKFLAFGDSITEGKTTVAAVTCPCPVPGAYPERLQIALSARYEAQTFTVINDGLGGETAGDAKNRLKDDLPRFNPEVLLIQEGVNELIDTHSAPDMSTIVSVRDALRTMVQTGKARSESVFVATLLPLDPKKWCCFAPDAVPILNGLIKTMAAEENVTLVDLNAAVPLTLIGSDGLHPTPDGVKAMTDAWFAAIRSTLETKTPAPSQSALPALGLQPPAQILPRR